jgi:serine/threonine protein kinase
LGEKAGEGAHGVVKRCTDKVTGEVLAVKTITLEREHILHLKKNFLDVKSLSHPHILVYQSIFFELKYARCYLLMDYLPYPNLQDSELQSEAELKEVVYQLLETVQYIHEHKICHRDIKPDNILYDRPKRRIIVIDFGISKKIEERGRKR